MKLSTRLKISFGFLILFPLVLFASTLYGLSAISTASIRQTYSIDNIDYNNLLKPITLINKMCKKEYSEIQNILENSPEKIHDKEYLSDLNKALAGRHAYLLIIESGEIVFNGNAFPKDMIDEIKEVDFVGAEDFGFYIGRYEYMINGIQYTDDKGSEGCIYFVVSTKGILPQLKKFYVEVIVCVIIILIGTSAIFTIWIYRSTVRPIKKLRLATENIKNGNLDFDLDVDGSRELVELCDDFDNMRKRLKINAEDKLKFDQESKELISNISHDLKTPITAIKGYVEGIMDGVADTPEKMERYIRTIYNKACDMDKLIDELAFYSKVDSNRINYNFIKIKLSEYFNDCIDEIGIDLESKNIELIYTNNLSENTMAAIDAEHFKRVITNVVGNSVKYMESENGKVEISLSEDEKEVFIDISDNGKGIAKKDIEHIFDRFYRSDSSRNSAKGGNGLGLSIVKKIIQDHGGVVYAESEPNVKTTIKIILEKLEETDREENTNN